MSNVFKSVRSRFEFSEKKIKFFLKYIFIWIHFPLLIYTRLKVKNRLRPGLSTKLKKIKVIAFPNRLNSRIHLLSSGYAIEKILLVLDLKPEQFDPFNVIDRTIYIEWQDLTFNKFQSRDFLRESCCYTKKEKIFENWVSVNANVHDISKRHVGRCFHKIFGYKLDVDPVHYQGNVVEKSDINALHDGVILLAPFRPTQVNTDKVYSIVINNIDQNGCAVDIRVPYIGRPLDFCYIKKRPELTRFSNTNESVSLAITAEIFSKAELAQIDEFCVLLGLDYGELDCLRDLDNGRLYIVDVAKTPAGPPNGISCFDRVRAISEMSVAFAHKFIAEA